MTARHLAAEYMPNARDHGIAGDGTDETANFQALASANGALFCPPGTYLLSSLTGLPHLVGVPGLTIFKVKPGTTNPLLTLAAGSNVRDIKIDGNGTAAKGILGTAGSAVVDRCTLIGMGGNGQIQVGDDSKVRGCSVASTGAVTNNKGIRISGNRVQVEGNTVDLTGSTGAGVTCISSEPTASNLIVRGNTLTGSGGAGVGIGNALAGTVTASHCVIADNAILNGQGDGILLGVDNSVDTGSDNSVTGNTIQSITGGGGPARDIGIETQLTRTAVTGNTVTGTDGHGLWLGGEGCAAHGNTIYNAGQAIAGNENGIRVLRSGCSVIGNTIRDVGNATINTCYGIWAFASGGVNIDGGIIAFNVIRETRAGAARGMTFGVVTSGSGATIANMIVAGNLPQGMVTAPYSLAGGSGAGTLTVNTYGAVT